MIEESQNSVNLDRVGSYWFFVFVFLAICCHTKTYNLTEFKICKALEIVARGSRMHQNNPVSSSQGSDLRLHRMLDALDLGLWIMDLATGRMSVNVAWRQIFGYDSASSSDFNKELWWEHIHAEDVDIFERNFQQVGRGDQTSFSQEYRLRTCSGKWIWVHSHVQVLDVDSVGFPLSATGSLEDVSKRKRMEKLLRESERSKSVLLGNLPGMSFRCAFDADWTMEYVSAGCLDLTGYRPYDLVWNRMVAYNELILPEYRQYLFESWSEAVENRTHVKVTYRIRTAEGKEKWVWEQGIPIYRTDGSVEALEGLVLDITARKEMELAAHHSMELMRYVVEHSRSAIAIHDRNMDYLYVSRRYLDDYRVQERDIIGRNHYEIFPDLPEKWRKVHQRALAGEVLSAENDPFERDDGSIDWTRWECRPWFGPDGSIGGVIVYTEIINKWKRMEAELSKSHGRLERLIGGASGPIAILDSQRCITRFNEAFERMTGNDLATMMGKPFHLLFDSELHPEHALVWGEMLGADLKGAAEFDLPHADGSSRTVLWNWATISDDDTDEFGYTIVQGQDITYRKTAEQQLRYMGDHDYLTGLYNRRYLEEELVRRDTAGHLPLTLVMVDTNGLKIVNDSFGHAKGDELLQDVAQLLVKGCRASDIVARYGGDEFVIVLSGTNGLQADYIISRIQTLAANLDSGRIRLSMSFGYATRTSLQEPLHMLFKRAEDILYRNKIYESTSAKSKSIGLVMNTLFEKSSRESNHSKRVSEICEQVARRLRMSKEDVNRLRIAGLMHDIGKIGVDETILNKTDRLTQEEWSEMRRHPEIGYRILATASEFSEVADFILEHQERWDGKGYPRGLAGEDISIQARIIAVADAFDAMTSDRTYRKGLGLAAALREIEKYAGSQFDPKIAEVFTTMMRNVSVSV